MNIASIVFILFVLATALLYYLMPRRFRWTALLLASLVFFLLASGWKMLVYLAFGVIVSYSAALLMERKCTTDKARRSVLVGALVLLAGGLFVLKDINFLFISVRLLGRLFSVNIGNMEISLLAPLGLSYYTLILIGYLLDVYWTTAKAQPNILKHALFTCYFPHMVSGPITRYPEMEPQLFGGNAFDWNNLFFGIERILWGLLKKLVIADRLAIFVNTVFADTATYPGVYIIVAVVFFAIQLYCDFSGCMDIVLGASKVFGVKLPENFDAPYSSLNVSEFWRRWHITLGKWSKDYLLYPLLKSNAFQRFGDRCKKTFGKKQGKNIPTYVALFIVWMVIGLWHGGSYKWIFVSGIMPWFYLVMGQILHPVWMKIAGLLKVNTECFSFDLFKRMRTIALMCFVWIFVCADSLKDGVRALKALFSRFNIWVLVDRSLYDLGVTQDEFVLLGVFVLILAVVERMKYQGTDVCQWLSRQNMAFRWFVLLSVMFSVIIFGVYGPGYSAAQFIYAGF